MSCEMGSRRCPPPPPPSETPPLEDEDLLSEILLRLAPDPSSLPRASAVSKRWHALVSDPGFSRRFRLHHRRNPPVLGFFDPFRFESTMDPPNRVPDGRFGRFFLQVGEDEVDDRIITLGCRHGLVLMFQVTRRRIQFLVWDPVTGEQHRIAAPPGFDPKGRPINGAVLRAAGDIQHFQVVLVGIKTDEQLLTRVRTRVYSSETGEWGDIISTLIPPNDSMYEFPTMIHWEFQDILVGHSLYWLLSDSPTSILEFDLDRQSLSAIHMPVDVYSGDNWHFAVMRAEGGGLGLLALSRFSAQLWRRKTDYDGVASWVLGRTIELDKLLPMKSKRKKPPSPIIIGFAEDNNVVFLWTVMGSFTIHLESLQFKKLDIPNVICRYYPLESVYAAGAGMAIGRGNDVAGQMDVI